MSAAVADVRVTRAGGVAAPAGFRRCTKKSCTWCISESTAFKTCKNCRDRVARWSATPKGIAKIKEVKASATYKESFKKAKAKYYATEKGKANRERENKKDRSVTSKAWRKTEKGRAYVLKNRKSEATKASQARSKLTPGYKARRKRYAKEMFHQLSSSLWHMVAGKHPNPRTFPRMGIFKSNADARQHFKLHFAPWMSFDNQGVYETGLPYNTRWHIGHGIPKAAYDPSNEDDLLKCWSRDNLRPQCARENNELRDRLPSRDWLNAHQHLWPASWMGILPAHCV